MVLSKSSKTSLKVLLVAPNFHTAIGILARYIIKNCPDIDFFVVDVSEAIRFSKRFARLVDSVDVVHWLVNLSNTPLLDANLPAQLPCPSVATVHHLAPDEPDKVGAANVADVIHVSCEEWLDYITPRTATPVRLAYYPIDLARFAGNRSDPRPRVPLQIGFVGVGSLIDRKRLDVLLDALALLDKAGAQFQLWVQSLFWPDVAVPGEAVHLLKFVPFHESWRIYADFDVYVCTSDVEGGPLTILEALASQVPVISTPVGLAPEVLANGGGLLINKNSPGELAAALQRLMHDPELYQRLQRETLSAVQQFNASIGEQYLTLYTAAIASWEDKNCTSWALKPSLRRWTFRLQRFMALGHDLLREAKALRALGQRSAAVLTLFRITNPLRFFE